MSGMSTSHLQSPSPTSTPTRELEDTQLDDSQPPTTSDVKYGFKIYRTDYSDESKWERFMTYLNAQVQARMKEENIAHEILNIDWAIETSPDIACASEEDIRRRFIAWVDSDDEPTDNSARFRACIVVDHDCLIDVNAVVELLEEADEELDEFDDDGLAWVRLVSRDPSEGSLRVCVSYLLPRTFNFVPYNWEQIGADGKDPARP
ncbi:hypothetical protein EKO04_005205 [Ascochyta lentis]|uniref:Uncharacterized protein n=1 Tax=Ascochyta lentis TaxID=205686 RepID=A0A8H7J1D1_9PLEO|nr:hypothetical protein EKO04_005205 [Ascochyta lentis]